MELLSWMPLLVLSMGMLLVWTRAGDAQAKRGRHYSRADRKRYCR